MQRTEAQSEIYIYACFTYDYIERFEKLHKDNILTYNEEDGID